MPVTAAPSLPRYSLLFDVAGSDEGKANRTNLLSDVSLTALLRLNLQKQTLLVSCRAY
jgi:hypothetical protein